MSDPFPYPEQLRPWQTLIYYDGPLLRIRRVDFPTAPGDLSEPVIEISSYPCTRGADAGAHCECGLVTVGGPKRSHLPHVHVRLTRDELEQALRLLDDVKPEPKRRVCSNPECEDGTILEGTCVECDQEIRRTCPTCAEVTARAAGESP